MISEYNPWFTGRPLKFDMFWREKVESQSLESCSDDILLKEIPSQSSMKHWTPLQSEQYLTFTTFGLSY